MSVPEFDLFITEVVRLQKEKKGWEVKRQERQRETERSLSSCCRMKMKQDETRERNDKTGSVIAIDLSAISATVSH